MSINYGDLVNAASGVNQLGVDSTNGLPLGTDTAKPFGQIHTNSGVFHSDNGSTIMRAKLNGAGLEQSVNGGTSFEVFGGGLAKQGTIISDLDGGEGIYNLNASAASFDFTLPSGTGSQKRYMFIGEQLGSNTSTVKVQSGDSLNSSLAGTFTVSTSGQVLLATDRSTGNWDLAVVGAGTSTSLQNGISVLAAQVDLATTGGIADLQDIGVSVTVPSAGRWKLTGIGRSLSNVSHDDTMGVSFAITDSSDVIVNDGGEVIIAHRAVDSVAISSFGGAGSSFIEAYVVTAGTATFKLRAGQESNVGGAQFAEQGSYLRYEQVPLNEVVLAGMVTPISLESAKLVRTSSATVVTIDAATNFDFDGIEYALNGSSASTATSSITVSKTNRYEINFRATIGDVASDNAVAVFVNGIKSGLSFVHNFSGGVGSDNINATFERDLIAGDIVSIRFDATEPGGYSFASVAGGGAVASLTVKELANRDVVNSNLIVPSNNHRARLRQTTGVVTLAAADTDLVLDTVDYNVGGIVSGGSVTIVDAGLYSLNAWAGNVTISNNSQTFIKVNGVKVTRSRDTQSSVGQLDTLGCSTTLELSINDVVLMGVFTNGVDTTAAALEDQPTLEVIQLSTSTVARYDPSSVEITILSNGTSVLGSDYDIAGVGGLDSFEDVGVSVIIPSAGRWQLTATIKGFVGDGTDDNQGMAANISDSANNIVNDGSRLNIVGDSDSLVNNATVNKKGTIIIIAYVTTSAAATYKIRASQFSNLPLNLIEGGTTLRYEQLPTLEVISPGDVVVNDQGSSDYIDIGTVRIAWGTTPGAAAIETVTFPGGGFVTAPVVTIAVEDASNVRELRVGTPTATTVVVANGTAARVKHWHAIGLKP